MAGTGGPVDAASTVPVGAAVGAGWGDVPAAMWVAVAYGLSTSACGTAAVVNASGVVFPGKM